MTTDWQRCCIAYQGGGCKTPCLHCNRMAEVVKTERSLFIATLRAVARWVDLAMDIES